MRNERTCQLNRDPGNDRSRHAAFNDLVQPARGPPVRAIPTYAVLVARGKRQQGDIASLLDGARQTALMRGAHAGKPPGHDLAALRYEALQQAHIAIRDGVDLFSAELADFLATEEFSAAARTAPGRPPGPPCGRPPGRGPGDDSFVACGAPPSGARAGVSSGILFPLHSSVPSAVARPQENMA